MSGDHTSKLCALILGEYFDETVSKVGSNLLQFGIKSLGQIASSTSGLSLKEVKRGVALLVKHNLVTFSDHRKAGVVDYQIKKDRILNLQYFPFYINLVSGQQEGKDLPPNSASVFGPETSALLQVLFEDGSLTASQTILKASSCLTEDSEDPVNIQKLWSSLGTLVSQKIIESCPANTDQDSDIPKFSEDGKKMPGLPHLKISDLESAVSQGNVDNLKDTVYWTANNAVCSRMYRDSLIVHSAVRRIDDTAGRIVRSILDAVAEVNDPWSPTSSHLSLATITSRVKKDWDSMVSHLDQYLTILTSDRTRFVDKVGDAGGGQYQVNYKHIFTEITASTLEKIILERFGSKSMRIFRFIREKKYVEENQLQQVVMIPGKEVKLLTYQLLENNFICLQELRKTVNNNAPSKAIYVFYVNFDQVVRYCQNLCLQSLYNLKVRTKQEYTACERLVKRRQDVEKKTKEYEQQATEDQDIDDFVAPLIPAEVEALEALDHKLDQCNLAHMATLNTLFILQTYLKYKVS
eukprot:TRINITY_DN18521_c0_g1_i2.p1 TRINITY_DN18521_c0_g1~~TRINITY_DN18521_c0_g1_i2.p1  ORF type:complete len:522 (+),score=117.07 TRINITY_DN18521_c0_g1_i2:69-1634(+)